MSPPLRKVPPAAPWLCACASLLLLAAGFLSDLRAATPPASRSARPNILWLIAEDFGPQLGCYGTKEVSTPNLDALAAAGVRYTRFFTTAPVCSPSRSAFMTGMYQTTIGAHNHRAHRDDGYALPRGVRVLSDWFRDAGYFTANVRELPEHFGFRGAGKTDWNFTYAGKPFDSDRWADLKSHQPFFAQINFQETHRAFHAPRRADPAKVELPPWTPDHPVAREDWAKYLDAASELDRKIGLVLQQLAADGLAENTVVVFFGDNGEAHVRGKQFCYDSGLHVPLIIRWPKSGGASSISTERHGEIGTTLVGDELSLTPALSRWERESRSQVLLKSGAQGSTKNRLPVSLSQRERAGVRESAANGHAGSTLSRTARMSSAQRPTFPLPQHFKPGTVDDRLLSAIDLAPTMLALAGAPKPAKMQGEIFLGDRAARPRRYVFGARDRCDETVFRFRTVRDARYRYIRNFTPDRPFLQPNEYKERAYPVWNLLKELHAAGKLTPAQAALCAPTMPAEELYDLETDPQEIHNLATSPSHQQVLRRLRRALEKWIDETNDQGRELEPPGLAARKGVTKPGTPPNTGYALDAPPPQPAKK